MKRIFYVFVLIFICVFGALQAQAAGDAPKLISRHGAWKAYSFLDNGEKVCFMSSQPRKQGGNFKQRGEVFFFVTRWSDEKDKNVISAANGYALKPGSQVAVTVDGKAFQLFTQGEMAWTKDQAMDDAIAEALKKGSALSVRGISESGTETTDTYSLKGSGAAYQAITKSCAKK
jgi:invasion protein IalB